MNEVDRIQNELTNVERRYRTKIEMANVRLSSKSSDNLNLNLAGSSKTEDDTSGHSSAGSTKNDSQRSNCKEEKTEETKDRQQKETTPVSACESNDEFLMLEQTVTLETELENIKSDITTNQTI